MADISTVNLDGGGDSPKLARVEILEAVNRVNALTRVIDTSVLNLVGIETNLFVAGNAGFSGNLQIQGSLTIGGGQAGQVLVSQGNGQPLAWATLSTGDKFKGASSTSFAIDAVTPKNIVVDTGLSFTPGQTVVVANDAAHYISGVVQSYNPSTGALSFSNDTQVGTGTFASWTVNVTGGKGSAGSNGTNGATWLNGAGAPAAGLGVNNDYYLNNTNNDYYQKQNGTWTLLGNLKGLAGAAGSKWYTGAGAPAAGLGSDGDYYLNQTTGDYSSKAAGAWTVQGNLKGAAGAAGSRWYVGTGAPSDALGVNTDMYLNSTTGDYYQKAAGTWGSAVGNLTGPAGSGSGGGGTTTVFGTTNRYQINTVAGLGVTVVASSSFKTGIAWTRNGTSMTFTDNGHGRSVGERAIIRNTASFGFDSLITAVTTNTFTVTCPDAGAASGSSGAYSMGFTYTQQGASGAITGGSIVAPANWDCVLISARLHLAANTRSGTSYNLTLPKGNFNGAGNQTGVDDATVPTLTVRNDSTALSVIGATISYATVVAGDYATFGLNGVGATTVGIQILLQF